jgi:hypothetical protein
VLSCTLPGSEFPGFLSYVFHAEPWKLHQTIYILMFMEPRATDERAAHVQPRAPLPQPSHPFSIARNEDSDPKRVLGDVGVPSGERLLHHRRPSRYYSSSVEISSSFSRPTINPPALSPRFVRRSREAPRRLDSRMLRGTRATAAPRPCNNNKNSSNNDPILHQLPTLISINNETQARGILIRDEHV